MAKIFISYARQDGFELANELANRLRALNHDVFLDIHGIPGGVEWEKQLIKSGKWADVLVLLITPVSNQSKYVYHEFREAEKNKKLIIPVQVDDTFIPPHLTHLNALPLKEKNYDALLLKLQVGISHLLKPRSGVSRQAIFIVPIIILVLGLFGIFLVNNNGNNIANQSPNTTEISENQTDTPPPDTPQPTHTPTDTPQSTNTTTPSHTPSPSNTPSPTHTIAPSDMPEPTTIPTELFLYQNDFESGGLRRFVISSGSWITVQDGDNRVLRSTNNEWWSIAYLSDTSGWTNYVVEGRFRWITVTDGNTNSNGRIQIGIHSQLDNYLNSYVWFIDFETIGILRQYVDETSTWRIATSSALDTYQVNTIPFYLYEDDWNTFRIEVENFHDATIVRTKLNQARFDDLVDRSTSYNSPYTTGGVVFYVSEGTVYFDDIRIYEIPDSEQP